MATRPKLLLLDDDQDLLELYKEILGQLPSNPEIHIATSGAHAISMLESDRFGLLVSDLNMPKMDGLQVLTIVRRKFPGLRTAVMTSVADEQFRARAYAMGIDLFLEKPNNQKEVSFFLDCIESMLGREETKGFRGVQSKSLVDIIQLECLSGCSSVLRITHEGLEGKVWLKSGEIIDASTTGYSGQEAFKKIMSWKTGNFEILPEDLSRQRAIFTNYQGLLLETAQAIDEAGVSAESTALAEGVTEPTQKNLAEVARLTGVAFALKMHANSGQTSESWGVSDPDGLSKCLYSLRTGFASLGENLGFGNLNRLEMYGNQQHVVVVPKGESLNCLGLHRSLSPEQARETVKTALVQWES